MKSEIREIKSIATATVGHISATAHLNEARLQMKLQHVRFLLVTNDQDNFIGLLKASDIGHMHLPPETRVGLLAGPVGFLASEEDLTVAAELLLQKNLSGLVLLDDWEHVAGVVTVEELLKFLLPNFKQGFEQPVSNLLSVASLQSLGEIANELSLLGI